MSKYKVSRRSLIGAAGAIGAATSVGAVGGLMSSAFASTAGGGIDLDTPQGNLDGFLKVRSDIGGTTSVIWAEGAVYGHIPGRKAKHLLKTQGVNLTRCIKDSTGYTFLQRESVYFCDLETGLPVDTWFNPYTEREVPVFHFQNESVSSHYDVQGSKGPFNMSYVENTGDVTFFHDLFYFAPSPLTVEEYSPYVGSDIYDGAGIYNWHAKRADIDNPDLATVPTSISHTGVRQWMPWMEMGSWQGGMVLPSRGKKLLGGVEELPRPILSWLEKNAPIYLESPPVEQKDQKNTFYGEFKKYVESKRSDRNKG